METNKVKVKTEKVKVKKKVNFANIGFMLVAFFATLILWGGLLFLQEHFAGNVTYKTVLVARENILPNKIITEDNIKSLFEEKQMNILDTTDGTLKTADDLLGKRNHTALYKGEVVYEKDFEETNPYVDLLENPVEISVGIDDIANAVGGKIRAGDIINVSMMFTKTQLGQASTSIGGSNIEKDGYNFTLNAEYIMENLYVSKVLDSSGNEIDSTNTKSSASVIFFIIERDEEFKFNNALANCTYLRISKVMDK